MLTTELVIASIFFIVAFAITYSAWYSMQVSYAEAQADLEMQTALLTISDAAVMAPGEPSNWESTAKENANSFGLAVGANRLSEGKLSALQSLNSSYYYLVKEKMGAGRFEVYINTSNPSGTLYQFGAPIVFSNNTVQASTKRLAMINDSIVTVFVQVWRTKG